MARCGDDGRLRVQVSGGSGAYNYLLENDCGEVFAPQQQPSFEKLIPCTYRLTVVDRQTNDSRVEPFTIISDYQSIQLSLEQDGCTQRIRVQGGRAPIQLAYSEEGTKGPFQSLPSDELPTTENDLVWVQATDDCGRSVVSSLRVTEATTLRIEQSDQSDGLQFNVSGGTAPYSFELSSEAGQFANTTGFFPWSEIGCGPVLTVRDQCPTGPATTYQIELPLEGEIGCVNFADGSAEIFPIQGVGPFRYRVELEDGTSFISEDGQFDDLPLGEASFSFWILDRCGNERALGRSTPYRLGFLPSTQGCADDAVSFRVERLCTGEIPYPLTVSCLSCPDQRSVVIEGTSDITFDQGTIGDWSIQVEDNCGDRTTCTDTLLLEIRPACDSIIAEIVQLFSCDDGLESRRRLSDGSARFELRDATGAVLESNNTSGIFRGLPPGTYSVFAQLNCGNLAASVEVVNPRPINPYYEFDLRRASGSDECLFRYHLDIERAAGPYVLTGGADDDYYQILDEETDGPCRFYSIDELPPGLYKLTSMSECGAIFILLPEPDNRPNIEVEIERSCPGRSAVRITNALRDAEGYAQWFVDQGAQPNSQFGSDRFSIDGTSKGNEVIRNLAPGTYKAYVEPYYARGCYIDSVEFEIPDYQPVELVIGGNFICEPEGLAELQISLSGGNGPYQFREVDCTTGSPIGTELAFDSAADFSFPDMGLGVHCFEVADACGFNSGFSKAVDLYADTIRSIYTCAPSVQLLVDSLPFEYVWKDAQGSPLGTGPVLEVPPPAEAETYLLEIDLGNCQVESSIELPFREVIPGITLAPGVDTLYLCGDTQLEVGVSTAAEIIEWSDNTADQTRLIDRPGRYTVQVTNDLGCIASDTVEVISVPNPVPSIVAPAEICPGDTVFLEVEQAYQRVFWESRARSTTRFLIVDGGVFSVEVQDDKGCLGRDSVEVRALELPNIQLEGDLLICPDATTVVGPDQAFVSYQWSNGATTPSQELTAGNYELRVEGQNGCFTTEEFSIEEYPRVSATLDAASLICRGDSAVLNFELSGIDALSQVAVEYSQGQPLIRQSLAARDSFRLLLEADTRLRLAAVEPLDYPCPVNLDTTWVSVQLTEVTGRITIDSIPCANLPGGALLAQATSVSPPLQVYWETYDTAFIDQLGPGTYTAVAVNRLGCEWRESVTLVDPPALTGLVSAGNPICPDGTDGFIAVDAVVNGVPPFRWSVDEQPVNGGVPSEALQLSEGPHQLELVDGEGCRWDTVITLYDPEGFGLELGADTAIRIGDSVQFQPVIEFDPVDFNWSVISVDTAIIEELAPILMPSYTSEYHLEVLSAEGCRVRDTVHVIVDRNVPIYTPTAFSPDGDGQNDFFQPMGSPRQLRSIRELSVFSRFGNQVAFLRDLPIDTADFGWDGTFDGQSLPGGVYVWMATVELVDGRQIALSGEVILVR